MISLDIIQREWSLIEQPSVGQPRFQAQEVEAVMGPAGHPLLVVDAQQHRHLLVPLRVPIHGSNDMQSAGLHLLINQWGDGPGKQWYVDLVCRKPHLNDLFDFVIFDIVNELSPDTDHPDVLCRRVLGEWRELLSRDTIGAPDKMTVLGAFGELWVLRELARRSPAAVQTWLGPKGDRRDFFNGTVALEVKTSLQRKVRTVTIHGHDQLEPTVNGELYLAVVRVEETPVQGESVTDLVETLAALGCERHQLLVLLAHLNLTPAVLATLRDFRFRVVEQHMYYVDDRFPRITSASFVEGRLPSGVTGLTYQIDLAANPPHALDPDEVPPLYDRFVNGISA